MRPSSVACISALSIFAGCFWDEQDEPCNPDIAFGEEYEVTVVGLWQDAGAILEQTSLAPYGAAAPPCNSGDILPGATFTVRIEGTGRSFRDCVEPLCPASFPTASMPYAGPQSATGSATHICMSDQRKVQLSPSCEAARFVGLADLAAAHLDRPTDGGPGSIPATILIRGLEVPAGASDALRCDAPEQSFPPDAAVPGRPGHWRCSDRFIVDLRRK